MSAISATRLPAQAAIPALAAQAKAAPVSSQPTPAAALDLSPAAKNLLSHGSDNVPWGNSPVR